MTWRIEVRGFPSFTLEAETRSKARAKAYRLYCEAGYLDDFRDFLPLIRVTRATVTR